MSKIYIILVAWNNEKDLPDLFHGLDAFLKKRAGLNFVFIDNGSQDNSIRLIKNWIKDKPEVVFFQNQKNLGFTAGNNRGIKHALKQNADYITLLNCDTQVEADFIDKAMEVFQKDDSAGIVQSLLMCFQDRSKIQSFGNALHYLGFGYSVGDGQPLSEFYPPSDRLDHLVQRRQVNYSSFSAVTIKKEVFDKIGLLDERYTSYHEDTDFCLRARLAGYKILLAPKSVVYHNHKFPLGKNRNKNKLRYFWIERNRFFIFFKFYKTPTLILLFPSLLFMEFGQIFFSLFNGFFSIRLKVYAWLFKNIKTIRTMRVETKKARKFGDKYLLENMVGVIDFQSVNNPLLRTIGNPVLNLYFKIIKKIVFW